MKRFKNKSGIKTIIELFINGLHVENIKSLFQELFLEFLTINDDNEKLGHVFQMLITVMQLM